MHSVIHFAVCGPNSRFTEFWGKRRGPFAVEKPLYFGAPRFTGGTHESWTFLFKSGSLMHLARFGWVLFGDLWDSRRRSKNKKELRLKYTTIISELLLTIIYTDVSPTCCVGTAPSPREPCVY